METLMKFGPLATRVLIAALFIVAGYNKIGGFEGTQAFIASVGLPNMAAMVVLAIVVELGGGLMLLAGFKTKWAALALIGFTIVATAFFHNKISDSTQLTQALKNLAIIGGLIQVWMYGAGAYSIDSMMGGKKTSKKK